MGTAIAARLTQSGFAVTGWDAAPGAVQRLAATGVATAPHARGAATGVDAVVTSVTDDLAVRDVFYGPDGVLGAELDGVLFVEMSTLQPATVRGVEDDVTAHGAAIVDAPVLGTIPNVRDGTLVALLGGDAADVARARPLLDVLARSVVHMGPLGAGHAMKLAVNLGLAAYVQGLAESLALGEREGLGLEQMLAVLAAAPTANAWLANRSGVVTGERDDVTLDIRTLRKDVMSALATGLRGGVTMPLSAGVLGALSAAVAGGWGDRDIGALAAFLRES
jgi:3-hydroxyisobutyrate dehydrogenase-like beta-hydroxyacid dehydrogenase